MSILKPISGPERPFSIIVGLLLFTACSSGESAPAPGQGARQGSGNAAATSSPSSGSNAGGGQRGPGGGFGPGGFGPGGGQNRGGPTAVEVARIQTGSLAREATVAGVLSPIRSVGVNAQLGGALLSVRVEEGDVVRAGQVLAEVDARELAAQARSAQASLELAKSTAERSATLFKDRVVTAAEHERDQAALAAAQATYDALRTRMGYAQIRAPTNGVVTEKRVEAGDVVSSQARLFTVADVSTLVVRVQVSELDITGLHEGQSAVVTIDAFGTSNFQGTIRRIFPAADSTTRMVPVEVALSGAAVRRLKPGYLARVTVRLGERPGVIVAPISAVVGARDARAVYVIRAGKAERRAVRLGQSSGSIVEILDGLKVGDSVVVVGAEQLRDGAAVRIVAPIGSARTQ
jgi:membrane fusion protein, multidrug efflux system